MDLKVLGLKKLGETDPMRMCGALVGKTGAGKTAGALSFLEEGKKALYTGIEAGAEGGAGGATTLHYIKPIYPWINPKEDVLFAQVRTWEEASKHFQMVRRNAKALWDEGVRLWVLDGGSSLTEMIDTALTRIDPSKLDEGKAANEPKLAGQQRNVVRRLVPNFDGNFGRTKEFDDYEVVRRRFLFVVDKLKETPFFLLWTFKSGPLYAEAANMKEPPIGVGINTIGRKLQWDVPYEFDFCWFVEQRKMKVQQPKGPALFERQRVWVTENDPTIAGNTTRCLAKTRTGMALEKFEPANGVEVMRKLKGALA